MARVLVFFCACRHARRLPNLPVRLTMKTACLFACAVLLLSACNTSPDATPEIDNAAAGTAVAVSLPDSAALITRLGSDTLAVERWVRTESQVVAEAVVRAPRTTRRHYTVALSADGLMQRFEERIYDPAAEPSLQRTMVAEMTHDGWVRTTTAGGTTETDTVQADPAVLPFIDLLSWPFELALLRDRSEFSATQPLLAGNNVLDFVITEQGGDSVIVRHPFRGPSVAMVDAAGRLASLDASATTRKTRVSRTDWIDIDDHTARWAALDAAGRGVGALSGRGETQATVAGTNFLVDYGTPSKRGRDIFGNVVPWGELWRTGANRATHFSTDRDLLLGDPETGTLEVPAGTYTLFTIPAEDGGVLIINRQTNQNGNSYDEAQDLGTVPMQIGELPETVEVFTIAVLDADEDQGILQLQWDNTSFSVPFSVQ